MNTQPWPFLFDLDALRAPTRAYIKRKAKTMEYWQELPDLLFSRNEVRHLRKRGLQTLLLLGAMAKAKSLDFQSSSKHMPPFEAPKALLSVDVPMMVCLEPGVDWQHLLLTASSVALEEGLYDWYANPNEESKRWAGYEVERLAEIVSIRACASLHVDQHDDPLSEIIPLEVTGAIYGHGTSMPDLKRALQWFMDWEAKERESKQNLLVGAWKDDLLKAMTNRFAFFWYLKGVSIDDIVSYLKTALPVAISTCMPKVEQDVVAAICEIRIAQFLAVFPDQWCKHGFKIEHLLGLKSGTLQGEYDFALHSLAEGLIHRESSDYSRQDVIFEHIYDIDPTICSAAYVDRLGTRQNPWVERVTDWAPAAEKLNAMLQANQWHPALHGLKTVDLLEGEASAAAALNVFLADGGNGNERRAARLLERYPGVVDATIPTLKKRSEFRRLASVTRLSSKQIQQLPERHRDVVMSVDLGL
ncbi:hypothetical protein C6380_12815 [Pseudomonas syringae pv. actinidiae]|uniref:hypothetical protein n=1 Tax=Pseudomonas syringae TaxID=317 RepID=UPI000BB59D74|nr:hypothetical protein [Pseudomonas syringae]PBK49095.1 hypothetical protein BUE61_23995 [Pseudomonas syringae pv. actinidiae]PBK49134.1 hypothetical protein BUE60_25100 [Pseudomonas syringae pv. actinidiae]RJX55229.1 hypothetical protein C6383_24765 [Pseudomonas syringae pv. actinidiae]RJX56382.1 hypothetical protein C6380_12815 [Pseudomonas syringae pv. actinidiae]RJX60632.1 hypothetical protein C6379_05850 [Pseudomonas syringae pv. actinidiae]